MSGLHTRWKSMSAKELRKECRSLLRGHGLMQVTLYAKLKKLEGRISKQRKEIVRLESIRGKPEPAIKPKYRAIDWLEALKIMDSGAIVEGIKPNSSKFEETYMEDGVLIVNPHDSDPIFCREASLSELRKGTWRVKTGEPS